MTDAQLKTIYKGACAAKGFEPNDPQFKIWKSTLGWCEERDLAQAMIWWYQENTTFPMPAELKTLAGRAMRERQVSSAEKTYAVMWRCPVCNTGRSGFLRPEDSAYRECTSKWGPTLPPNSPRVDGKRPERKQLQGDDVCGAVLTIVTDERPAA